MVIEVGLEIVQNFWDTKKNGIRKSDPDIDSFLFDPTAFMYNIENGWKKSQNQDQKIQNSEILLNDLSIALRYWQNT